MVEIDEEAGAAADVTNGFIDWVDVVFSEGFFEGFDFCAVEPTVVRLAKGLMSDAGEMEFFFEAVLPVVFGVIVHVNSFS